MMRTGHMRQRCSVWGALGILLLMSSVAAQGRDFGDVAGDHRYAEAIGYVSEEGIVNGYADGQYRPEQKVNRAEFAKIMVESRFTDDEIGRCGKQNLFADVAPESWYAPYVCMAREHGIIHGYGDVTFQPARFIGFGEAAKMIVTTFGYSIDDGDDAIWYRPFVLSLQDRKAIAPSITSAGHEVTRGEVAEIIFRLRRGVTDRESSVFQFSENVMSDSYLPVLMYHHVLPLAPDHPDRVTYTLSVSPDMLERQLQFFRDQGVVPLTFSDLERIVNGDGVLPAKGVMLTFDDGYRNNFDYAFPLLEKYQMKANFAIITGDAGTDDWYMDWGQIEELSRAGHDVCSHTHTHPNLAILSEDRVREELGESKAILEQRLGKTVGCVVYPAGKYNAQVQRIADELGYRFGRTTEPGKRVDWDDLLRIPTTRMFPTTGLASLRIWFGG